MLPLTRARTKLAQHSPVPPWIIAPCGLKTVCAGNGSLHTSSRKRIGTMTARGIQSPVFSRANLHPRRGIGSAQLIRRVWHFCWRRYFSLSPHELRRAAGDRLFVRRDNRGDAGVSRLFAKVQHRQPFGRFNHRRGFSGHPRMALRAYAVYGTVSLVVRRRIVRGRFSRQQATSCRGR